MDAVEPVELQIIERLSEALPAATTLTLPFELRQKSRLRTWLDNGADVGLFLPRGTILRHGDRLRATNGLVVEVRAALESVSTVRSANPRLLARAAFHLGNRHVPLQVDADWLRYLHDHVLDHLVEELGLEVSCEQAPFEPEAGAHSPASAHHHHHSA